LFTTTLTGRKIMQDYRFKISGIGELFFGKHVADEKKSSETHDQREERLWQQKIHVDSAGGVVLQPFAIKNALESAAKRLSRPIPGMGKSTFSKLFRQGILCVDLIEIFKADGKRLAVDDVEPRRLFVPSDGRRGSGKRVFRIFPAISNWTGIGSLTVFDDKITLEILREHLAESGRFIGLGSMRVENGGICGRFVVDELSAT
jgi:hypothetical protein